MGGRTRQFVVMGTLALAWSWSALSSSPVAPAMASTKDAAASTKESAKQGRREVAPDGEKGTDRASAARGGRVGKGEGKDDGKNERVGKDQRSERVSTESAVAQRESRETRSNAAAAAAAAAQEWPQIQSGVWQIEGTLKQANGRHRHWTEKTKQCEDPTVLFQGHRGRTAGKHGCTFQSTKVSGSEFKVTAECMVPKKGLATSESTVTVKSEKEFEMQIHLHTQKKDARTSQTGRWVSACSGAR